MVPFTLESGGFLPFCCAAHCEIMRVGGERFTPPTEMGHHCRLFNRGATHPGAQPSLPLVQSLVSKRPSGSQHQPIFIVSSPFILTVGSLFSWGGASLTLLSYRTLDFLQSSPDYLSQQEYRRLYRQGHKRYSSHCPQDWGEYCRLFTSFLLCWLAARLESEPVLVTMLVRSGYACSLAHGQIHQELVGDLFSIQRILEAYRVPLLSFR